jgi:hypothetical protein
MSTAVRKIMTFCQSCMVRKREYTEAEILFDSDLTTFSNYCINCYVFIYHHIAPCSVQFQRQECLFDEPHYWGVLNDQNFHDVLKKFPLACMVGVNGSSRGVEYWWEFSSRSIHHDTALVLAITNRSGVYNRLDSKGFPAPEARSTVFIHRSACGIYHVSRGGAKFTERPAPAELGVNSLGLIGSFPTLYEALRYVRSTHITSYHSATNSCDCLKLSRFSYEESGVIKPSVWSLQELSAFRIRNTTIHNRRALYRWWHTICRDIVKKFNAPLRHHPIPDEQLALSKQCRCGLCFWQRLTLFKFRFI